MYFALVSISEVHKDEQQSTGPEFLCQHAFACGIFSAVISLCADFNCNASDINRLSVCYMQLVV